MIPPEAKNESAEKFSISRSQIVVLGLVLILIGALISGRQFGWFGAPTGSSEPVAIPSGAPYAEATVVGAYEDVVLAERVAATDAQGNALQKKLEILVDENTTFAKLTSSNPVRITYQELSENDIVWVYQRVRSLEETLAEPVDPELAISFEESIKNPRERVKADFVVAVSIKK